VDPPTAHLHPGVETGSKRSPTTYSVSVFGRTKSEQAAGDQVTGAESTVRTGGKGRPTPSRREAEARNRRPLVGTPALRPNATKEEKKAARATQRAAMSSERAKAREAMVTGDDRHLPARDKGPVRRFARDYVDARRSLGEYLLPAAFVILVVSILPYGPVKVYTAFLLYGLIAAVAIDSFLLRRNVLRAVTAKFGANAASGVGGYAMMRAIQMRRTRLPRPQVQRGQYPH